MLFVVYYVQKHSDGGPGEIFEYGVYNVLTYFHVGTDQTFDTSYFFPVAQFFNNYFICKLQNKLYGDMIGMWDFFQGFLEIVIVLINKSKNIFILFRL